MEPLIVQLTEHKNEDEYTIISGHQRLAAWNELVEQFGTDPKKSKLPCVVLPVSDKEARMLNLAMNKIQGEFDPTMLASMFVQMPSLDDEELLGTGFTQREIDKIIRDAATPPEVESARETPDLGSFGRSVTLTLKFDSMNDRDRCKGLLEKIAAAEGKLSGDFVLELLEDDDAVQRMD